MEADPFRVLLAAAAYVLFDHIRRTALVGNELELAAAGTIRRRLSRVGARMQKAIRRAVVRIASGFPGEDFFRCAATRLRQSRDALDSG